jgi:hypothetical protein
MNTTLIKSLGFTKKMLELLCNCDNFDEDKCTLKFMEKYGINNV